MKEVYHEDTEKFIVAGEVNGNDLVCRVSEVVDEFMIENLANWLSKVENV